MAAFTNFNTSGIYGTSVTTYASLPPAANVDPAQQIYVSNLGAGNFVSSNGSRFKAVNGGLLLDSIDTPNPSTLGVTTEQQLNPNHRLIPAGTIKATDRLRITVGFSKSGATDLYTIRFRIGPSGTPPFPGTDPIIFAFNFQAANLSAGAFLQLKRISATSIRVEGANIAPANYSSQTANAYSATVTGLSNLDTIDQYFSVTVQTAGTTDTTTLEDMTVEWLPTDS